MCDAIFWKKWIFAGNRRLAPGQTLCDTRGSVCQKTKAKYSIKSESLFHYGKDVQHWKWERASPRVGVLKFLHSRQSYYSTVQYLQYSWLLLFLAFFFCDLVCSSRISSIIKTWRDGCQRPRAVTRLLTWKCVGIARKRFSPSTSTVIRLLMDHAKPQPYLFASTGLMRSDSLFQPHSGNYK